MHRCCVSALRLLAMSMLATITVLASYGQEEDHAPGVNGDDCCGNLCPPVAIKSNLLYDAALTPDAGVEISLSRRVSVGLEGVYAWWSNDRRHRYWRVRGGWIDVSLWFGSSARRQRLTGHHAGIYVSMHDYDFEFGHKGWQARNPTFGAGLTYGYSFRLNGRLSLDLYLRTGYAGGKVTEYVPQCGSYTCIRQYHGNYWGLTGAGISLVWFPGRGSSNNPAR